MASSDAEARKLDREVHDTISQLTDRLSAFDVGDAASEKGVRIITIAGDNKGATMKKLQALENQYCSHKDQDTQGEVCEDGDDGAVRAYANSNYQAVNNSVLVGGSCAAEDPGIHIEVVSESLHGDDDDEDEEECEHEHERERK
ncbi:uncharacterized protein LOC109715021 [Ananas comosus]|uniref:Uncharacterized protein LOC109715021 n=1 Tax=Ananas comosus TaxID=4615 RepID=A0A6P5FQP4_ANACO|nr:uncharacterized protein LOC109715021 [Ananas comosus]